MATGKRYYWIKLKEAFLTSDAVDYLMSQPDGANYVILYQLLCLKTINTDGKLSRRIGDVYIPYDAGKIQRDCKWFSADTIRAALNLYRALGLVIEGPDGALEIPGISDLVGSETDAAARMRTMRAGRENALPNGETSAEQSANIVTQEIENRDKTLEVRDLDITDEEREIEGEDRAVPQAETAPPPSRLPPCPLQKIMELYHQICVSLPRVERFGSIQTKAITGLWACYGDIETIGQIFRMAQASAFLRGDNARGWQADLIWIARPGNAAKILDHRYDDHKAQGDTGGATRYNSTDLQGFFADAVANAYKGV